MSFNLQDFIDDPSYEKLYSCRKDDLLCIAAHFDITVQKYGVKKDIQNKVLEKLIELQVLTDPVDSVQLGAEVPPETISAARPGASPVLDYKEGQQVAQATPLVDRAVYEAPPATLPRFEPFSPESHGSSGDAKLKVRLARLQLEAQEKESRRKADYDFKLQVRKLEIEAEKEVKLRQLEVEAMKISSAQRMAHTSESLAASQIVSHKHFDVSKNISLVPTFRETEVDSYFGAFERIATALKWPKDMWSILLQCKLVGKAQEVVASLSLESSLEYDVLKESILRAYELVPEAYRQKFRNHKKSSGQTFVEFAREKGLLFDKWCSANDVKTSFESLRELMLLEDFKSALPEKMVIFLNEQKVSTLSKAAVLADEFVLTHKNVFMSSYRPDRASMSRPMRPDSGHRPFEKAKTPQSPPRDTRKCFYCHDKGHVIADCLSLKRKQQFSSSTSQPKGMGLIKTVSLPSTEVSQYDAENDDPDPCFRPFISEGFVSLTGDPTDQQSVTILRDSGGAQSIILEGILPLTSESSCHSSAVVQGVEMGFVLAPLHKVHLQSPLVSGIFKVAVLPALPIKGVDFILGNDIAGDKVVPAPEVLDRPDLNLQSDNPNQKAIFPACVVTRAQSKKYDIDLSDSFMVLEQDPDVIPESENKVKEKPADATSSSSSSAEMVLPATREEFIAAQQGDSSLSKCSSSVLSHEEAKRRKVAYAYNDGLLMRRWVGDASEEDADWSATYQVVVPMAYRSQVLSLAHDHPWSGHMGVTKTYNRVLRHFFWPGLKSDVVRHCNTCHVCQVTGKPNQVITPAPLCPFPVMGQPFEKVIIDCVGPLPKSKSGNQFLLTVMCASTRFPEAIPLRRITAPVITKALVKFFTVLVCLGLSSQIRAQILNPRCLPRH